MKRGTPALFYVLAIFFAAYRAVSLRPDDRDLRPVVPGPAGRPHLPDERRVDSSGSQQLCEGTGIVDLGAAFRRSLRLASL